MRCEKCGIRDATLQYVVVLNGTETAHHLCAECAKEMGLNILGGSLSGQIGGEDPISKIISGLLGLVGDNQPKKQEEWNQGICPNCGTSYADFVEGSRFGCPECYSVFDLLMKDNLKKIQGSDTHVGKRPLHGLPKAVPFPEETEVKPMTAEEELIFLQEKLKAAIEDEEFEDAAKYRDQIRICKERINAANEMV